MTIGPQENAGATYGDTHILYDHHHDIGTPNYLRVLGPTPLAEIGATTAYLGYHAYTHFKDRIPPITIEAPTKNRSLTPPPPKNNNPPPVVAPNPKNTVE